MQKKYKNSEFLSAMQVIQVTVVVCATAKLFDLTVVFWKINICIIE